MPEQITINSLVDSIKKGRSLTQCLLIVNQFLKSWTKNYSGSDLVGCARGDAEAILPVGMQDPSAFPMVWRREEGISWEETEEGILFLHLSVFIFTLVWPCLPLCSVCFKSDSEFMEPFRRLSHNLWFMTSCRNCMLVNNTLSVWNCISELWNITSADKSF